MRQGILFTSVLLFLIVPSTVSAATIYVNSSSGNDSSGDGTSEAPYKTFHKAYTEAAAGDVLDLTGTFDWSNADETGDSATGGYTISKDLTIQGQTATSTFVQASSSRYTADRGVFTVSGSGVDVTIRDLNIRYGFHSSDSGAAGVHMTSNANLTMINTVVTENVSVARFGTHGIRADGAGSFILRNSTVHDNDGVEGQSEGGGSWTGYAGGLRVGNSGGTEITNSTFFGNKASYNGGVYQSNSGSVVTMTNSTFSNNQGNTTSHSYGLWSGTAYVKNSIFANRPNTAEVDFMFNSGAVYDGGHNIVETQSGGAFTDGVNGTLVGEQANLNLASSLATNDATTTVPTLALSSGSVAINAGTTTAHNGIDVPAYDQRYASRSGATDIGAFEFGGTIESSGEEESENTGGSSPELRTPPEPTLSHHFDASAVVLKGSYNARNIITDRVGFTLSGADDSATYVYENAPTSFTHYVRNLECETNYEATPFAVNSIATSTGEAIAFSTPACESNAVEESSTDETERQSYADEDKDETTDDAASLTRSALVDLLRAAYERLQSLFAVNTTAPQDTHSAAVFARDLTVGMEGEDVRRLQEHLIKAAHGPSAKELERVGASGYFGTYTKNALGEFQKAVGITPYAGYFGPKTRRYITNE